MESQTVVEIIGLGIGAVGLYLVVMASVEKRFGQYVRKGEQDLVNNTTSRDIGEIKTSLERITDRVERLVSDVPGIIQRAIREEFQR